jgi:hypothetical protein
MAFKAGIEWENDGENPYTLWEIEIGYREWRKSAFGVMGDEVPDTSGAVPSVGDELPEDSEGSKTVSGSTSSTTGHAETDSSTTSPALNWCEVTSYPHTLEFHSTHCAREIKSAKENQGSKLNEPPNWKQIVAEESLSLRRTKNEDS